MEKIRNTPNESIMFLQVAVAVGSVAAVAAVVSEIAPVEDFAGSNPSRNRGASRGTST